MIVRAIIFISCLLLVYILAYTYLKLNNKPVKSDIVVLFIGPEYEKRLKEAHQLLKENYAQILIIPAYRRVFTLVDGTIKETRNYQKNPFDRKSYPPYYENTHIEVLEAKKMMGIAGYSSAIFVSAPYHMRRISIIASRVFETGDCQISYIGSRYLRQDSSLLSILSWANIKQTFSEYLKILGFFLYQFYEFV